MKIRVHYLKVARKDSSITLVLSYTDDAMLTYLKDYKNYLNSTAHIVEGYYKAVFDPEAKDFSRQMDRIAGKIRSGKIKVYEI